MKSHGPASCACSSSSSKSISRSSGYTPQDPCWVNSTLATLQIRRMWGPTQRLLWGFAKLNPCHLSLRERHMRCRLRATRRSRSERATERSGIRKWQDIQTLMEMHSKKVRRHQLFSGRIDPQAPHLIGAPNQKLGQPKQQQQQQQKQQLQVNNSKVKSCLRKRSTPLAGPVQFRCLLPLLGTQHVTATAASAAPGAYSELPGAAI